MSPGQLVNIYLSERSAASRWAHNSALLNFKGAHIIAVRNSNLSTCIIDIIDRPGHVIGSGPSPHQALGVRLPRPTHPMPPAIPGC